MGARYEGSLAQWIDTHRCAQLTLKDTYALAAKMKAPYSEAQLRRARVAARFRQREGSPLAPRKRGPGALVDAAAVASKKRIGRPPGSGKKQREREAQLVAAAASELTQPAAAYSLAERKAQILASEVQEDGPPPKHTALRKLILDVGLDAASEIFEEFKLISERMR